MTSRKFVWDPEHWRLRAEEARTVADQMIHEEARTIMRRIANDYDRLAKVADEQLAAQERGATGAEARRGSGREARPTEDRQGDRAEGAEAACQGHWYSEGSQIAWDWDWYGAAHLK